MNNIEPSKEQHLSNSLPSKSLIFRIFKKWLQKLYASMQNLVNVKMKNASFIILKTYVVINHVTFICV